MVVHHLIVISVAVDKARELIVDNDCNDIVDPSGADHDSILVDE